MALAFNVGDRIVDLVRCRTGYIDYISRGGKPLVEWHGHYLEWILDPVTEDKYIVQKHDNLPNR